MQQRKRSLTDILSQGKGGGNVGGNWIDGNWEDIPPAPEFGPVDPGKYEAHLIEKEPFNAGTGTPGIKLTFLILTEGPFKSRKLWYDIWLTEAAKPQAIRDFAKLGIHNKAQIDSPLPTDKRIRCRVVVTTRKNAAGVYYNVIQSFEPIGVDNVSADPFAPPPSNNGGPTQ